MKYANSKKQGDAGLGQAIGWFATQGLTVSVPLTDSQDYDLIVDTVDGLDRVQVRTCTSVRYSDFIVQLCVKGGNKTSIGKTKAFSAEAVDSLFVVTGDGNLFWIPSCSIKSKYSLTLNSKWDKFKVGQWKS